MKDSHIKLAFVIAMIWSETGSATRIEFFQERMKRSPNFPTLCIVKPKDKCHVVTVDVIKRKVCVYSKVRIFESWDSGGQTVEVVEKPMMKVYRVTE